MGTAHHQGSWPGGQPHLLPEPSRAWQDKRRSQVQLGNEKLKVPSPCEGGGLGWGWRGFSRRPPHPNPLPRGERGLEVRRLESLRHRDSPRATWEQFTRRARLTRQKWCVRRTLHAEPPKPSLGSKCVPRCNLGTRGKRGLVAAGFSLRWPRLTREALEDHYFVILSEAKDLGRGAPSE